MSSPQFIDLNFSYKKAESDVWVLNFDDIPVEKELIKDQQIAHLAPGSVGGNNRHPRTEWLIGIGDLVCIWLDENGVKHEEHMNPSGQIRLVIIPPLLPHAVVNRSENTAGLIYEMADGKMKDVELVKVY